jgi:hypothetical protein
MKQLIVGGCFLLLCAAMFAAPLYYQVFVKDPPAQAPAEPVSVNVDAPAPARYMVLASENSAFLETLLMDTQTGRVYLLDYNSFEFIYRIS